MGEKKYVFKQVGWGLQHKATGKVIAFGNRKDYVMNRKKGTKPGTFQIIRLYGEATDAT